MQRSPKHSGRRIAKRLSCAAIAAAALGTPSAALASPFDIVSVLGSLRNGSGYTSNLVVPAGDTVYYEVVTELAQTAVTNSTNPYTLAPPQTSGSDGVNSLTFALTDANGASLSPTIVNGWDKAASPTGPVQGGYFVGQSAGTFAGGASQSQIMTGSLVAGSSADTVVPSWDATNGSASGGLQVQTTSSARGGVADIQVNQATETGAGSDPYVGYSSLSLTVGNPLASLSASAPTTYGSPSLGKLQVPSSPAGTAATATVASTATGYFEETGIANGAPEYFALKLSGVGVNNNYTDAQIAADINLAETGVTATTVTGSAFNTASTFAGFDILITAKSNDESSDQFLGFDFSTLTGIDVTEIGAVPEPTCAGLVALAGLSLMRRRRPGAR